MSIVNKPFKVGPIKWGFDSCYRCYEEFGNAWCGHSVVEWHKRDCEILEVKFSSYDRFCFSKKKKIQIPDWMYLIRVEKWKGDIREEWVPHDWLVHYNGSLCR